MASLGELYPDCVETWFDPEDGEKIPSVRYECVWRHIVREGERVLSTKDEVRKVGKILNYNEQDSKHVLVRVKGKGWFAIAEGKPAVAALARSFI